VTLRSTTKLTERLVSKLQPRQLIWDAEVRGFGVRCQGNTRVYVLKTVVHGRQKFITIGAHESGWTVDLARRRAQELLVELRHVGGPAQLKTQVRKRHTVESLCNRYLNEHASRHKKPRSAHEDQQNIRNHVIPLLGSLFVDDVTKLDVEAFREAVLAGKTAPVDPKMKRALQRGGACVAGGPGAANRCLALLSKMFNFAEEWGLRPLNTNPVRKVMRYRENRRDRFLKTEELVRLGKELTEAERTGAENQFVIAALRLLIYTGARLREILTLRWEWVDLDRKLLLLPDSKTGAKIIRLSDPAISVLHHIPKIPANPFVIVGARTGKPLINLQRPWRRIRKSAGLDNVRIHDLRHTFASLAIANGFSLPIVGSLLGHTTMEP
jgi:integrase